MSLELLVLLLALVVEDQNLSATAFANYLPGDLCSLAGANFTVISGDGKHIKLHLAIIGRRDLFQTNYISGRDTILLSPGADDRVHKASDSTKTGRGRSGVVQNFGVAAATFRIRSRMAAGVPSGMGRQ